MRSMFSVVIPAYNCEKTIERVLDSVMAQTRFDLITEIIVINDGSTDNTDAVIKDYIKRKPGNKINYIIQENHGVSYTRNKGIRIAEGEWIALLDSDDVWNPVKIERQYEVIASNQDIKFLGCQYPLKVLLKKRTGLVKLTPKELCLRSMPTTPSVVFERKAGVELGLYNESMRYSEDINFFQKFLSLDSYYILAEDLVTIGIGKEFYGQSGLTANIRQMHLGRNRNVRELYEAGLISKRYMILMLAFNQIKYMRRFLVTHMKLS